MLAATVGFGWAFAVNAASFGVSALVLVGLRAGEAPRPVVLGPVLLKRWSAQLRRPRVVFAAFGLRGVVDLVLASVTVLPAAVASLVFDGLGTSTGNVTFASVLQSHPGPVAQAGVRGRRCA